MVYTVKLAGPTPTRNCWMSRICAGMYTTSIPRDVCNLNTKVQQRHALLKLNLYVKSQPGAMSWHTQWGPKQSCSNCCCAKPRGKVRSPHLKCGPVHGVARLLRVQARLVQDLSTVDVAHTWHAQRPTGVDHRPHMKPCQCWRRRCTLAENICKS